MPSNCAVASCKVDTNVTRLIGEQVSLFRFPKNVETRNTWIAKCKRVDPINVNNARICSRHFAADDFERDIRADVMNVPARLILKENAVPSVNLPSNSGNMSGHRCQRLHKRNGFKEAKEIVVNAIKDRSLELELENITLQHDVNSPTLVEITEEVPLVIPCAPNSDLLHLHQTIEKLAQQNEALRQLLNQKEGEIKKYRKRINSLQTQFRTMQKKSTTNKYAVAMNKLFTPCQRELLLGKKMVRWKENDIAQAFTLRYLSKPAYLYLRKDLNYPLPALSTLSKWASKFDIEPGLFSMVLRFMEIAGQDMAADEKLVVLSFDEVKVDEKYEFDKKRDQMLGPFSQMQVVHARGLFSHWKSPVFADFDRKMNSSILHNIINELQNVGFTVVACVSDCGGGNVGLWKELGVTYENHYFVHSLTGTNIYFFADAPHLLKLARNWFLDKSLMINEKVVSNEPVKKLILNANDEISSTYKLTNSHISCEGPQRQNVSLAAQLLSHTTAAALRRYYPDQKLANDTADFITTITSWFDVMNSHQSDNSIHMKSAYGKYLDEQNTILDEMYSTILNLRCKGARTLQTFQKGILMSIKSLRALFVDMHQKYDKQFILTYKLNQDVLENLFSQLRTRGGLNDHPTPLQALYRLRLIILGKSTNLQSSRNTNDKGCDESIIGKVLLQCKIDPEVASSTSELSSVEESENPNEMCFDLIKYQTENDGLEYLAGWIAKKLRTAHPELGDHTAKIPIHEDGPPSWIKSLSYGGLTMPTLEFKYLIRNINTEFCKIVGDALPNCKKINKKLFFKLKSNFEYVHDDILRAFIRQRIFIRINYLNFQYVEGKRNPNLKKRINGIKARMYHNKMRKVV